MQVGELDREFVPACLNDVSHLPRRQEPELICREDHCGLVGVVREESGEGEGEEVVSPDPDCTAELVLLSVPALVAAEALRVSTEPECFLQGEVSEVGLKLIRDESDRYQP